MEDKMDVTKKEPVNEENSLANSSSTRRKLIQGSPLLLLLANRPAFSASCSISGFMSAKVGTSLTTHDGSLCDGWSPGNWKNDRGQITSEAWDTAGVFPDQSFASLFSTSMIGAGAGIRIVTDGVVGDFVDYSSGIGFSVMAVLEGAVSGGNNAGSVVKHAAACYLNSSFLANGGAGAAPDPWMNNYISISDIVGLYLLYELVFISNPAPAANVTYLYERSGNAVAESQNMTSGEFASFFHDLSNGSASNAWQNG